MARHCAMARSSRPGQFELQGTDDAPPYRVYWRPPADLAPGEILAFIATADDLRGHRTAAEVDNVAVAPGWVESGIRGATLLEFTLDPPGRVSLAEGARLHLEAAVKGTLPIYLLSVGLLLRCFSSGRGATAWKVGLLVGRWVALCSWLASMPLASLLTAFGSSAGLFSGVAATADFAASVFAASVFRKISLAGTTVLGFSATVFSATAFLAVVAEARLAKDSLPALAVGAVTAFALTLVLFFTEPVTGAFDISPDIFAPHLLPLVLPATPLAGLREFRPSPSPSSSAGCGRVCQ